MIKPMVHLTLEQMNDFTKVYDYLRVESEIPVTADAIIAGGSGTRVDMAERAAELYHEGRAPIIVFSGFSHPKFNVNESALLADRAKQLGVPGDAILCEPNATNTGLNVILAQKILQEHGIIAKNIILVHKPYMTRRFIATAEAQWVGDQPKFYVTSVASDFTGYLRREEALGLGDRMLRSILKDYAVIKTHPALGYQTQQPVDKEADNAYQRLIAQGFEKQAINHDLATDRFTD